MPRTAEVIYVGDAASIIRASQQAAAATEDATARIGKTNDKIAASSTAASKTVSNAARDIVLGFAGAAAATIDYGVKLEESTAKIQTAGGTSAATAKKITQAFLETQGSAEFSAQKIGEAYAGIAGELKTVEGHSLTAAQATKVMGAAMDLTEASGGELNATTETLGKVLFTYGLSASSAAKASDILFNSSTATGTSIETIGQTVDRMRGRLGALAPSLAATTGLMDDLAKQGISGRQSLSSLTGVFTTLLGSGTKVQAMSKYLGLEIFNSQHQFVGLKSVIEQLQPKLEKLAPQYRLEATEALFGASAGKQLLGVILEGPKAYEAATKAVEKHGTAAHAAAIQQETLQGQAKKLKTSIEDVAGAFGEVLTPALEKAAHTLQDGIQWLEKNETAAEALAVAIGVTLSGALTVYAYTKAVKFVEATKSMVGAVSSMAEKVGLKSKEVDTSLAGQATAAEGAATKTTTAQEGLAAKVATADETIVASNEAAGASFATMLGPIALVASAVASFSDKVLNPYAGQTKAMQEALKAYGDGNPSKKQIELLEKDGNPAFSGRGEALNHRGIRTEPLSSLPHGNKAAFAKALAAETGLPVSFISAWMNHEQGSSTVEGGNNWLNLETGLPGGGSGPHGASAMYAERQTPQGAAHLEAEWLKKNLPGLLKAHSASAAVEILERSGYAESHYGNASPASFLSAATTTGSGTLPSPEEELASEKASKPETPVRGLNPDNNRIEMHTPAEWSAIRLAHDQREKEMLRLTAPERALVSGLNAGGAADHAEAARFSSAAAGIGGSLEQAQLKAKAHPADLSTSSGQHLGLERDEYTVYVKEEQKRLYQKELVDLQREAKQWAKARAVYLKAARHATGTGKKEALDRAAKYAAKIKQAEQTAKELHGTISTTEAEVTEGQSALEQLPIESYETVNTRISAEQRAGRITETQAKALHEANASKALAGGYGKLSENGVLQVEGDLKEFSDALQEATGTLEAHNQVMREASQALAQFANVASSIGLVEAGSFAKSLADTVNGQIGGVNLAGRKSTPGAGTAARY